MAKRILILTPRVPFPTNDGGALAMFQTIEMYKSVGFEVSVLSINTNKHWLSENDFPPLFRQIQSFEAVAVNTDLKPTDAFINLFSKQSYNVSRFIDKKFSEALALKLSTTQFDIIQFESIYTAPYLEEVRKQSQAFCICRVHNIEHLIWEQVMKSETSFMKKKYLQLITQRLKKFELDVLNQFDELLTISTLETEMLKSLSISTPVYYLPYGVEKARYQSNSFRTEKLSIYHLGSMDWLPNQEAINWFSEQVWPKLRQTNPHLKFYVAGKNMPSPFFNLKRKGIDVVGEVDDATTFSLEKNILVIPLQSGAGVRIKITEAMLLGKTIISTSHGAMGFPLIDGVHLWIANTPKEFVEKIQYCLDHAEASQEMGERARNFVLEHFEKRKIYNQLKDHFESLSLHAR